MDYETFFGSLPEEVRLGVIEASLGDEKFAQKAFQLLFRLSMHPMQMSPVDVWKCFIRNESRYSGDSLGERFDHFLGFYVCLDNRGGVIH